MENISQNARSERQGARASDEGHGQEHGPGREQRQQQGREQRQRQANADGRQRQANADGRQRQASAGGRQPRVVSAAHLARLAAAREAVALPPITYPEDLPVSAHRREISDAIAQNQVVIVAGETGSGKTTQIPKILLELGRGRAGQIGHTQPRRIAARSVAERIAAELDTPLGQIVGYQVRFTDQSSDKTLVKVMTDGILLAQLQRDPRLLAYDTIVIDEAHERSLNIDFLLGYLARLLPTRPDLKLIITSATIDSERFAEHFSPANLAKLGGADPLVVSVLPKLAPIIEVTGRTYPVEVRYRPLLAEDKRADNRDDKQANKRNDKPDAKHNDNRGDRDLPTAIVEACDELMAEGPGDILVFLSGEREIKDAADALSGHLKDRLTGPNRNDAVELLPLYSRLSAAEQHRIFAPHDRRRIVLATNVAETSLTVPGVRYVVDSGLARISRYSKSTKVQRLPIEPISRASARQRSGRSGREAAGVAIRLFSEDDFEGRDEFTEPEILRTSLAAVLLQMIAVGVVADPDEVTAFPFVQAPDTKAVRDGVVLLRELGALTNADVSRETPVGLTAVGRQLAALPIDPRLARMVLEGVKLGVGAEVVVIAAALSIQDPRERPQEERDFADQLHSRFVDPNSDFLTMLNLWNYLLEQQNTLSGSAFRRLCKAEFIHYLRVREWQDLVSQIRGMAGEIGLNIGHIDESAARGDARKGKTTPGDVDHVEFSLRPLHSNGDQIHRALLPGLLSQLGMQETRDIPASAVAGLRGEARARALRQAAKRARNEYLGARGTRFAIYPGSPISSKPPAWLMAGELVETSRLWARQVARINPDWIEGAADHLVRKSYANPHWSAKKGAAMATEKVMLYGLPIVTDRKVLYGKIDAPAAREMFIRHALIQNEWRTHHDFQKKNQQLLAEISQQVARSRRRDLITDEEDLFRFYDKRIPETVISGADFDYWWKSAKQKQPKLLTLTAQALAHPDVDLAGFPDTWTQGDLTLPLSYEMAPGTEADGVTLHIPVSVLARVENAGFDWLVPGMLEDLCVATIRSLPKPVRVQLVPAPDAAREIAAWLREHTPDWADMSRAGGMADSFGAAFAQAAAAVRGVAIPADTFDEAQAARLPAHLRMRFSVEAPGGKGGPQVLGASLDLPELQRELAPQVQTAVAGAMQKAIAGTMQTAVAGAIRTPFTGAPFIGAPQHDSARESKPENLTAQTKIPESVQVDQGGVMVRGYPALVAGKGSATLEILSTPEQVAAEHAKGVRALLAQQHRINTQRITSRWTAKQALTLAASAYPSTEALVSDLQLAAVGALTDGQFGHPDAGAIRSQAEFQAASKVVQANLENEVHLIVGHVVAALTAATELRKEIAANSNKLPLLATLSDIKAQLNDLLAPSFIVNTPPDRLPHLVRYLRAASHRIEKAAANPARDTELAWQIGELTKQYEQALAKAKTEHKRQDLELARWLLQELRVSYFAQHLGTIGTVSAKRFTKLLAG